MPPLRACPLLAVVVLNAAGCSGASRGATIQTPGCVAADRTPHQVVLRVGQPTDVSQACPVSHEGAIRGPVRLTALNDGLRIQFGVTVSDYSPGPYRDEGPERDAVVVFPRDTGPGQPAHQLGTAAAPGGYAVDDVVPWSVWDLREAAGSFRLTIAIFNRYSHGFQIETRFTVLVTVTPSASGERLGAPPPT